MIILRIYALVWVSVLAAAGGFYYTGSFNEVMLDIFGFVSSTLFAMGFVAVLPIWIEHHFEPKTYSAARLERISKRRQAAKARMARNIHGGSSYVTQ